LALVVVAFSSSVVAGQVSPNQPSTFEEQVEVIATRLPNRPHDVPAPIEVIDGEMVRNLGATTLNDALALATGVVVAPGGDSGPAGSVPEFWGLREFDAFLLVVDDVPWGGAFNPASTTLNLRDVDRIEILRGPAPVTYGATSFVGVIHVVHRDGTAKPIDASVQAGSFGSGSGAISFGLPRVSGWDFRFGVDGERRGFSDERTSLSRGHTLWRGTRSGRDQKMWAMVDLNVLAQHPASPSPLVGTTLAPIDTNQNPAGAFLNEQKLTAAVGIERPGWHGGRWTMSASFGHSGQDVFRGFLSDAASASNNATGFREQISIFDIYADTHLAWSVRSGLRFIAGSDFLHGNAAANGATFDYFAPLGGTPATVSQASGLGLHIEDRREFFGAYSLAEWDATQRLRVTAGLRLNVTFEEGGDGAEAVGAGDKGITNTRPSGSLGAMFSVWQRDADHVKLYVNYRDTFKPAAVDFGLAQAEDGVDEAGKLKPETAHSYEAGLKVRTLKGHVDLEADAFVMDFANLVTATTVNGLPALVNTGTQRFEGVELSGDARLAPSFMVRGSYSFHDAHFLEYAQVFDGVATMLNDKRLEMSPRHLWSAGILRASSRGPIASVVLNITGSRYLNRRNTVLADGFATVDAGFGYRWRRLEVRIDGRNLRDQRDPVSESELGEAQYYRMTARRVDVTLSARF
jgi:iron complex outermembrane receptor protein